MLRALGLSDRDARSSIRLGFGRYTERKRSQRGAAGSTRRRVNRDMSGLTQVRFFKADGTLDNEVEAQAGARLLDLAWAERQPLEGGVRRGDGLFDLPCDRRHGGFRELPPASEEEDDLLDLASGSGGRRGWPAR